MDLFRFNMKLINGKGYSSTAAKGIQQKLLAGTRGFNVHSRCLGNMLYMIASQSSKPETLRAIEGLLLEALD